MRSSITVSDFCTSVRTLSRLAHTRWPAGARLVEVAVVVLVEVAVVVLVACGVDADAPPAIPVAVAPASRPHTRNFANIRFIVRTMLSGPHFSRRALQRGCGCEAPPQSAGHPLPGADGKAGHVQVQRSSSAKLAAWILGAGAGGGRTYALCVPRPIGRNLALLLSICGLAFLCACGTARRSSPEVGFRNPAALEAALKVKTQDMFDDPGGPNFSPGLVVTSVECTVGARTLVGTQLFSCTVYTSNGESFPTPVLVSSNGMSFTNSITTQHSTPTTPTTPTTSVFVVPEKPAG